MSKFSSYTIPKLIDASNWADFETGVNSYLLETGAHFFIPEIAIDPLVSSSSAPSVPSASAALTSAQLIGQLENMRVTRARARVRDRDPSADGSEGDAVSDEQRLSACLRCRGFLRRHIPGWMMDLAQPHVPFVEAFRAIRNALFESSVVQSVDLLREWGSLRQSIDESVSQYFIRVSALRSKLVIAGQPMGDKATLVQLTAGLLPSLLTVARSHLESKDSATLSSLKIRLLTHEQDLARASSVPPVLPSYGLAAGGIGGGAVVCDRCHQEGHIARECPAAAPARHLGNSGFGPSPPVSSPYLPPNRRFGTPLSQPGRRHSVPARGQQWCTFPACPSKLGHTTSRCPYRLRAARAAVAEMEAMAQEDSGLGEVFGAAFVGENSWDYTFLQSDLSTVPGGDPYSDPSAPAAFCTSASQQPPPCPADLVVDSAATDHMTPDMSLLTNVRAVNSASPTAVRVGNDALLPVAAVGQMVLQVQGSDEPFVLSDVLLVPGLALSLVSIPSLCEDPDLSVVFKRKECDVYTSSGTRVLHGGNGEIQGSSRLYYLQGVSVVSHPVPTAAVAAAPAPICAHVAVAAAPLVPPPVASCPPQDVTAVSSAYSAVGLCGSPPGYSPPATALAATSARLWHRRMGHPGSPALRRICASGLAPGLAGVRGLDAPCECCIMGKMTRGSRPPAMYVPSRPLYRLTADICGPFHVEAVGGYRYFLHVVDHATRYAILVPVNSKSQATQSLQAVILRLQREIGQPVVRLRSDRGGEFIAHELSVFMAAQGIFFEPSVPYTPESHGQVERAHRSVMDKARCMLFDAKLPATFWAEACRHANYLRNLIPVAGSLLSPYELFWGKSFDYSPLRVFGSLCWSHVPEPLRNKLSPRANPAVYLGTDLATRTHWVYVNGAVREVRDVVVDESTPAWPALHRTVGAGSRPLDAAVGVSPPLSVLREMGLSWDPLAPADSSCDPCPDHVSAAAPDLSAENVPRPVTRSQSRPAVPSPAVLPLDRHTLSVDDHLDSFDSDDDDVPPPAVVCVSSVHRDPSTYREAMDSPAKLEWGAAVHEELESLASKRTFDVVDVPVGARMLPSKWVFKTKLNPDGSIERFKARLVAGGHRQTPGVDFTDTYSPVSAYAAVRALLAVTAARDLVLHGLDISSAFLNGDLSEPVFMRAPAGFELPPDKCLRLRKSLYGLKQAPRVWFQSVSAHLSSLGFVASHADQALWTLSPNDGSPAVYLVLWVDDFLIASSALSSVAACKQSILDKFPGRDLGEATRFLNLDIVRDRTALTLSLSQQSHVEQLLDRFGMLDSKPLAVPMLEGSVFCAQHLDTDTVLTDSKSRYMEIVGVLLYLSCTGRPDITTAVSLLSRVMSAPTQRHMNLALDVLRYLNAHRGRSIVYRGSGGADLSLQPLQGWCDSDLAGDTLARNSRTGFVFCVAGGAIAWCSKLQPNPAMSTAEAEYVAASHASREGTWLRRLLADLGCVGGLVLHCDSKSAIAMADNTASSARTKHIDLAIHSIRSAVARQLVSLRFIPTAVNVADTFTKPLGPHLFVRHVSAMGMS